MSSESCAECRCGNNAEVDEGGCEMRGKMGSASAGGDAKRRLESLFAVREDSSQQQKREHAKRAGQ